MSTRAHDLVRSELTIWDADKVAASGASETDGTRRVSGGACSAFAWCLIVFCVVCTNRLFEWACELFADIVPVSS